MMWITSLLFVASVATAIPSGRREEKAFSLFSVVQFPNDECTTTMAMRGVCLTAEECTSRTGGSASGNCASGFGVCCFTSVDTAQAITNNMTYITQTGFPTAFGTTAPTSATARAFPIQGNANIVQIRLDFEVASFAQPAAGACTTDSITVASPAATFVGFTALCGTLTGQHIYIETDGASVAATVNIDTGTTAFSRSWKILVIMIDANSLLAPDGCLQFFTGKSGQISSFNAETSTSTQGMMLSNLNYNACIRSEGSNCIRFREARTTGLDSFNLQVNAAATPAASARGLTNTAGAITGGCATEAIIISGVSDSGNAGDEFCGGFLNPGATGQTNSAPVISNAQQHQINVFTDGATARVASTSFDLIFDRC